MGSLPFREGTGFREPVPGTGSGNRFRELVPGNRIPDPRHCQGSGFRRFRARGFAGFGVRWARLGSVPELWTEPVLGTRGIKKVPGCGDSVPKVPRKLLCHYFESILVYLESIFILLYLESLLLSFESMLLYFESMLLYFESILLYLESILLYFESVLLYFESILLYFERALLYFESIALYLTTMLASGCIENQYSRGKEKVVISVHFIMQTSLLLGIPPTLICFQETILYHKLWLPWYL